MPNIIYHSSYAKILSRKGYKVRFARGGGIIVSQGLNKLVDKIFHAWHCSDYGISIHFQDFLTKTLPEAKDGSLETLQNSK